MKNFTLKFSFIPKMAKVDTFGGKYSANVHETRTLPSTQQLLNKWWQLMLQGDQEQGELIIYHRIY